MTRLHLLVTLQTWTHNPPNPTKRSLTVKGPSPGTHPRLNTPRDPWGYSCSDTPGKGIRVLKKPRMSTRHQLMALLGMPVNHKPSSRHLISCALKSLAKMPDRDALKTALEAYEEARRRGTVRQTGLAPPTVRRSSVPPDNKESRRVLVKLLGLQLKSSRKMSPNKLICCALRRLWEAPGDDAVRSALEVYRLHWVTGGVC